ncbi:MAG: EamA family transporter [Planctomycetaceae bacterium]|nr:EamA family transporter [Planctomycetaceae bacterium]
MKALLPLLFALGTACCWGLYGPTLGKARSFEQSPFKPYVFIGVAYLVWSIAGSFIAMYLKGEPIKFTTNGMIWGFASGTLGAGGAFFLTLAMFYGGAKFPHVVMAVVFGSAATVAALVSLAGDSEKGGPGLWVGIVGMVISAVLVAYNTPHPHPPKKPPTSTVEEVSPEGTENSSESTNP